MQDNGYSPLRDMAQGKRAFDNVAVQQAYSVMRTGLDKVTGLWPPKSPSSPETRFGSSPKVWENKADFEARLNQARKIVAATQSQAETGIEGVKAALSQLDKGCGGCHEDYRVRQR
jgi:cytochrome c556